MYQGATKHVISNAQLVWSEWMKHNLLGRKFGKLTVVSLAQVSPIKWNCECECGGTSTPLGSCLVKGNSTSCGCKRGGGKGPFKHGQGSKETRTPAYISWSSMRQRTDGKAGEKHVKTYGEVTCDPRWAKFENFYADMGDRPDGHTLDRIDGNKGYTKENCRWATYKTQTRNRSNTRYHTEGGLTMTAQEWAETLGMKRVTVYARIKYGRPLIRSDNAS